LGVAEAVAEYWEKRRGFIFAAIGSAIGLGNIWRFSYLCYKDGGGAFLVPYFIALLIVGVPLIILEFVLGNYFRGSPIKVFASIRRPLEIFGWFAVLDQFIIGTYYSVVLAWVMCYIGFSAKAAWWSPSATPVAIARSVSSVWNAFLSSPGLILAGFAITWFITWITLFRGVSGGIEKACTFAIPALWVLSAILVVRGVTLPHHTVGINWYLTPNWSKMANGTVWIDAFGQILFTLSLMAAPLVIYAAYMPPKSELPNSAWITAFANCGFSFFFGFATWGIIGFLMGILGITNPELIVHQLHFKLGGVGLAFLTIPAAVSFLPGAPISTAVFGTIFFVILWLAGYTSLLSIVEPVYGAIRDKFRISRKVGVSIVCGLMFLFGLIFVFMPGLIGPVDFITGSTNLIWLVMLEAIIAGWMYSMEKLIAYANPYAELKLGRWWEIFVKFISPIALAVILGYGLVSVKVISPASVIVLVLMTILVLIFSGIKWRGEEPKPPEEVTA